MHDDRLPNTPETTAQLNLRDATTGLLEAVRVVTAIVVDRHPERDRVRAALEAGGLQLCVALEDATGLLMIAARPTTPPGRPPAPYVRLGLVFADPSRPTFGTTPEDAWLGDATGPTH